MKNEKRNNCPTPAGILVVIGGKEEKGNSEEGKEHADSYIPEEVLKSFVDLIGKKNPNVKIVSTGSSVGDEVFNDYKKVFNRIAEMQIEHIHHNTREEVLKENLTEKVNELDAVFITGGDQLKLTSIYGGTPFLTQLKERYIDSHIVVAGTSAGAMALSTPMIYAGNEDVQDIAGEIKITTGLEFLKDVCVDTHFVNRGRFIRLAQVIATNPTCIGIGMAEDTAIVVAKGELEVIGSGMVTIMDGFQLSMANIDAFNQNQLISIRDLRVHLISKGDKYKIPVINPPHY